MKSLLFFTLLAGCFVFQATAFAYKQDKSIFQQTKSNTFPVKLAQRGSFGNRFGGRSRNRVSLRVGQVAPDFNLTTKDGKYQVRLSSYRNKKPVVLIFGSYT